MRVIDQRLFSELRATGDIQHESCEFLDDIKIGLRINSVVLEMPETVVASDIESIHTQPVDLINTPLLARRFYLATTTEKIRVSNRILGFLHTRSRWARLGLDCLGSSNFLSPGFGGTVPVSLVLELRPALNIHHIDLKQAIAAMVLFKLDEPVVTKDSDHHMRFPLGY
jgi:deoxycytidine triphosphate deaminase